MPHLENPNPTVYKVAEIIRQETLDGERDEIDSLEVFGKLHVSYILKTTCVE